MSAQFEVALANALMNAITLAGIAIVGFWLKRQISQFDELKRELVDLMAAVRVLEQLVNSHERRLQIVEDRCFNIFSQHVREREK